MKEYIDKVAEGDDLSMEEAKDAVKEIFEDSTDAQ
ncbi:MAG: anthranilate phosphoribosyltransferase, partial [Halobacteria archaeon]|nr:anthranilate phosphoribosyltransferase [Halobacteria archaeon]